MTVHETHQAMEAVTLDGGMISTSVSGLTSDLEPRVAAEMVSFVGSASASGNCDGNGGGRPEWSRPCSG